jgi:hypothetical protein
MTIVHVIAMEEFSIAWYFYAPVTGKASHGATPVVDSGFAACANASRWKTHQKSTKLIISRIDIRLHAPGLSYYCYLAQ